MVSLMFFGCNESNTTSAQPNISNTDTLQPPITNKAVQPPKPPAL